MTKIFNLIKILSVEQPGSKNVALKYVWKAG